MGEAPLCQFPRDLLAKDVTPALVRTFLNRQEDAGLQGYTLRKQLGGLSMVFEFLIRAKGTGTVSRSDLPVR